MASKEPLDGASVVKTIDITPTWEGCLPILLTAFAHGTDEGRRMAETELKRMARLADAYGDAKASKA